METDDDGGGDEDTLWVERARASDVASVEGQLNAGYLTAFLVVATCRLVEQSLTKGATFSHWTKVFHYHYLNINMTLKDFLRVEVDGNGGGSALDLGVAFDAVVDGDGVDPADEQDEAKERHNHVNFRVKLSRRGAEDWFRFRTDVFYGPMRSVGGDDLTCARTLRSHFFGSAPLSLPIRRVFAARRNCHCGDGTERLHPCQSKCAAEK
jgi:hypothetical protein